MDRQAPPTFRPERRHAWTSSTIRRLAAAGAITWAVAFALLHAAWAVGARLLLHDTAGADEAFGRLWFRIYNAAVVVGSLSAAGLVIAAVRTRAGAHRRRARRLLWLVAGLLVVRGGIGVAQLLLTTASGSGEHTAEAWSVDLLMLFGGVIFCAAAWTQTAADGRTVPSRHAYRSRDISGFV